MITETIGFFYMLSHAGLVVKLVIILLLFFSITSWTIIFIKFMYIKRTIKESADFIDIFWQCHNLTDAFAKAKSLRSSPIARIFIAAYMEIARSDRQNKEKKPVKLTENFNVKIISSVKRTLNRSISAEVRRLVQLVPFLATAGNTAPFIGLFGTVWGIMDTFQGIGLSGSASLAVVAPGISEALIATAAGLAVAIPSVIAYNYFTDKIRVLDSELRSFSSDLLNIMEWDIQKQMEE